MASTWTIDYKCDSKFYGIILNTRNKYKISFVRREKQHSDIENMSHDTKRLVEKQNKIERDNKKGVSLTKWLMTAAIKK